MTLMAMTGVKTIPHLESGITQTLKEDSLKKIAEALGVLVSDLFDQYGLLEKKTRYKAMRDLTHQINTISA